MSPLHARRRDAGLLGLALVLSLTAAGPAHARPAAGFDVQAAPDVVRAKVPAQLGAPQPFLAGLTSQQQPVLLRFSADRRTLTRALTTLNVKCTSGSDFWLPDGFRNVPVSSLRRFRVSFSEPARQVDPTTSIASSGLFSGQVDRTGQRASGTWRLTFVERNPTTNAVTDTCTTNVLRFSVHR
jgi:hypothetical protein